MSGSFDSFDTSWHFGGSSSEVEQDLDFQVVSSSEDGIDYGLLESVDETLVEELFERGNLNMTIAPVSKSLSFDQGFVLTVRAIQVLRNLKRQDKGSERIIIGIGGPGGSGKSSLAHKIACVVGCVVISLENYIDCSKVADENYETFASLDIALLKANLEDIFNGQSTEVPLFDMQKRERIGFRNLKAKDCSVVILEGAFALHEDFSKYLDIKISIVGGVHYNLVKRVHRDLKKAKKLPQLSEENVLQTVFSSYKEHIEPHLKGAHIFIKNDFDHLASLRKPLYMLKAKGQPNMEGIQCLLNSNDFTHTTGKWIDTHIKPPGTDKLKDWLRIRQCGGLYSITFCEWIVEGDFVISPRVTFATGVKTLGSLLSLGYEIGMSIKRSTDIFTNNELTICIDNVEDLQESYISIKGLNRQAVLSAAEMLGISEAFITKSTLELCLESTRGSPKNKGKASTSTSTTKPQTAKPQTSLPMRLMQAAAAAVSSSNSSQTQEAIESKEKGGVPRPISPPLFQSGRHVELVPITKELSYDQGLLMAVRGVQKLREHRSHINNGNIVIIGIGGPSGSGKSRLAQNMAELLNGDVLEMDNYYVPQKIHEDNFDEFGSMDTDLLCSHLGSLKEGQNISIPQFDITLKKGTGQRSFSATSGIIIVEGVYALHKKVRPFLDFRMAVVGGVHFNLVKRVHRDSERAGRSFSQSEVLDTIFPLFRQHIEPGLRHAHLRIRNHFDPLTSLLTPQYVLRSEIPVASPEEALAKLAKMDVYNTKRYTDIYLSSREEGRDDGICIRQTGGKYTYIPRTSLREDSFIIEPAATFEVGVKTLTGLITLGYKIENVIEVQVTSYKGVGCVSISVEDVRSPLKKKFIQIKSKEKLEVEQSAFALGLQTFTTKSLMELIGNDKRSAEDALLVSKLSGLKSPEERRNAFEREVRYEIAEMRTELKRLNYLMFTITAATICSLIFFSLKRKL